MKKLLLMVIALILVTGVLSAQIQVGNGELTIQGKVASGVFFDADDAPKETPAGVQINDAWLGDEGRVRMWNESDPDNGLRADLSASYTAENIGFRIRLRVDNALDGLDRTAVGRFAYGWVDLFNDSLRFTGGYIDLTDANVWGTLGDLDKDVSGNGVRAEVKPFNFFNFDAERFGTLNFGAFFRIPIRENPNHGRDDDGRIVYRRLTPRRIFQETAIGMRYTHPWFYLSAQYEMDSDLDGVDIFEGRGSAITHGMKVWSNASDEQRFMFGAGFTMIPELQFSVEGLFEGLGNREARGWTDLRQTIAYTFSQLQVPVVNRLTLGMHAQQLLWSYDLMKHIDWPLELSPWMQFKPFLSFAVTDAFTAGFEMGFGSGHLVLSTLASDKSNVGDMNEKDTVFVNEKSNNFFKPFLEYRFTNGLALKAWYKVTLIKYDDLGDDPMFNNLRNSAVPRQAENTMLMVDSLTKRQFALEFIWTF